MPEYLTSVAMSILGDSKSHIHKGKDLNALNMENVI